MIVIELLAVVAGFTGMVLASSSAVQSATKLAVGSRVPPYVIGLTLLSIGTDLPEFANSVAASVTGHGDVNIGDGVGSAVTQLTLVLGLLPLLTGVITIPRRGVQLTGIVTLIGLAALALFLADGHLARVEAVGLLAIWIGGSYAIHRRAQHHQQLPLPMSHEGRARLLGSLLLAFLVLAGSATVALWGLLGVSERFGVPEFIIGFFVASLGTSLPELVFDLTAIRRGETAMAIGDVMGSSFIDVTAAVALGPLIAPIDVTTHLAIRGIVGAMVAVAVITVLFSRAREHDWRTGTILLALYAGFFVLLL